MSSIKKTAIIITIISLICKLFGFGREVALAYFFGTSFVVDAYLMASSIPTILFGWLTSLSVSFIPIYMHIREKQGVEKSEKFTNNIMSLIFAVAIICVLIVLIFNKQVISITASGFKEEMIELTSQYLNVSIWIVLFIAPIQILTSYLNCNNNFIQSSISNFAISSVQLLMIFFAGILNDLLLVYGVLISNIIQFIIVYAFSYRKGFRLSLKLAFTPEIKQVLVIVVPIFISSMIAQIGGFLDKSFASRLAEGSIASLNYAYIMFGFIFSIFSVAITTMIYPMLSQATAEGNMKKLKDIFSKGTNITMILFIPITIGAIVLAKPAISFAFERGEFGSSSTMLTTSAFIMYTIGLLAVALREVIIKVFYSLKETKATMFISVLALGLDFMFNVILIKPMGHAGLALGTSLSAIITIPIFFIVLRKKLGALGLKNTLILFAKACASTLIMSVVVYFGFNYLSSILGNGKMATLLSIVLSAGAGGLIYFVLMIVFRVKEMDVIVDMIKKIFGKIIRKA